MPPFTGTDFLLHFISGKIILSTLSDITQAYLFVFCLTRHRNPAIIIRLGTVTTPTTGKEEFERIEVSQYK